MNLFTIETALRIAGLMLTGLIVANYVAAKRWNYSGNLMGTMTIIRQIFHVHSAYVVTIITGLALLCLGWPLLLMEKGMGQVVSAFFAVFWLSRVIVQLTYYDRELRAQNRGWDVFFLAVFLTLSVIFALATFFP
jgi:hypothetical protein